MNSTPHFVDYSNVWLAYNDDLPARGHFAVEGISLQVGLVTIGAMAMAMTMTMTMTMRWLFSWIERRTTGSAYRGTQGA